MHASFSEADCLVCGNWKQSHRCLMRLLVDPQSVPADRICGDCFQAFWVIAPQKQRGKRIRKLIGKLHERKVMPQFAIRSLQAANREAPQRTALIEQERLGGVQAPINLNLKRHR